MGIGVYRMIQVISIKSVITIKLVGCGLDKYDFYQHGMKLIRLRWISNLYRKKY